MRTNRSHWYRDTSWRCFSVRILLIIGVVTGVFVSVHFILSALKKEEQSWKFIEFSGTITSGKCHEALMDTAESSYINMNVTYQFQNLTHNTEVKYAFDFCNLNNFCCHHLIGQKVALCASYHTSDPSNLIDIETICWKTRTYGWEFLEVFSMIGILIVGLIGMILLWLLPTKRIITTYFNFNQNAELAGSEDEIKL